jgi:4-amino-4-deoxy-L-arabinose transferase
MFAELSFRYLDSWQIMLLLSAIFCLTGSVILFALRKINIAMILLGVFALTAFLSAAFFDPFLHLWDERFHVLVAKNMMYDPFMPVLYQTPLLEHETSDWSTQHVWLHKQPLFMWQMALSMKIFGPHDWAARLPDVLLGICLVFAFYRSGKLLRNENTGYLAAFLFVSSGFLFELVSGKQMLDHNDFVFVSYVSLSVWSWLEYQFSDRKKWIFLIGLFAGCAILCKWLPGLFVYLIWFVFLLLNDSFRLKKYRELALALLVTALVVLPWQVYIFLRFPNIAAAEFALNTRHFFEVVEGHGGTIWFHFLKMNDIFGYGALVVIPIAWFYVLLKKEKQYWKSLFLACVFVYVFFSLAKTKMPAFTAITILPALLAAASLIDWLLARLKQAASGKLVSFLVPLLLLMLACWRVDPISVAGNHGMSKNTDNYWFGMRHNALIWKQMKLPENGVIFNATQGTYLECMFYTGLPAYDFLPSKQQLDILKDKGYVACIIDASDIELPTFYSGYQVITDDQIILKDY